MDNAWGYTGGSPQSPVGWGMPVVATQTPPQQPGSTGVGQKILDWVGGEIAEWWTGENGQPKTTPAPPQPGNMPGCQMTVPVRFEQRARVPRGYVVVNWQGQKIGMLKAAARACGLWKPSKKPPISAKDWGCLQRANRVVNRIEKVVTMSNNVTGKADLKRTRPRRK